MPKFKLKRRQDKSGKLEEVIVPDQIRLVDTIADSRDKRQIAYLTPSIRSLSASRPPLGILQEC
jgi:hypothetical protein